MKNCDKDKEKRKGYETETCRLQPVGRDELPKTIGKACMLGKTQETPACQEKARKRLQVRKNIGNA